MTQETKEGAPKPKTFAEAFEQLEMSPEEEAAAEAETYAAAEPEKTKTADPLAAKADDPPDPNVIPDWVEFPQGFKIPPHKQVAFLKFRAKWTERPDKGDRWCMLWSLSDAEEKLAIKRTRGEHARTLAEFSKQMIRLIDGKRVDWSGSADMQATHMNIDRFWDDIGGKCRSLIQNYYVKTHSLDMAEQADFFVNCLHVRTATVG